MSVGLPITKNEVDGRIGDLARNFQRNFQQVETLKLYFDATPDPDLIALGYTSQEVAILKTAVNDLNQLLNIWLGQDTLEDPKNFTTFVRQVWGLGAF